MPHLSLEDRKEIERLLRAGASFKAIAEAVRKSPSTVMREVRRHAVESDRGAKGRVTNRCVKRSVCRRQFVCGRCTQTQTARHCAGCAKCNSACPEFEEMPCERLARPPYVCNGCGKEGICVLRKRFYIAEPADKAYRELLVGAREGLAATRRELDGMAEMLRGRLRDCPSLHHVIHAFPDDFRVCERTVYAYLKAGALPGVHPSDLPAMAGLKPRRRIGAPHRVVRRCAEGRRLEDFRAFMGGAPDQPVVEMDSVEGERGGKVLLTLNLNFCGLMLAFIRDANTSASVIAVLDMLEETLGLDTFRKLFPVILTDNGPEFSNPAALETSPRTGEPRTRVFYCDPYSAWQKAHVENNHLILRGYFPKGACLDGVTQEAVNRAMSNMNSLIRREYGDVTAIARFEQAHGPDILPKLGVFLIPPKEVVRRPVVRPPSGRPQG